MKRTELPQQKSAIDSFNDMAYELLKLWPVMLVGALVLFVMLWIVVTSPAKEREQRSAARVDQAADDQLEVQGTIVTVALLTKLQPLGWDLHGEVRDDGHLHVTTVAPGVMDKVEAKELALLMVQQYVAQIPTGKFVHVTVNTPAGQTLARAADRAR